MFTGTYGMGLMGGLMQTVQTLGNNIGNMVAPLAEDEEEQITRMIQDQLLASDDDRPDCNSNEEDEQDMSSLENESENGSNASFRTINLSSNTPSESDSLSGLSHPNIPSQSFQYHPSNPISPLSYTHTYNTQQQDNGEEEEEDDDDDDMYPVNLTESLQIRSPPESPMMEIDLATPQDLNIPSSLPPYIHSDVKTSEETAEAMAAESTRLSEALADSEAALKQAEEYLYIAKGENSELICNEESKNSTIQSLNEQIETLKREILIPPVSEKSSFPEPEFEKDRLFSALKSSVELIFITKQISTRIHNSGVVVTDSSANLPSDIAGMIEVLNASILEVNDALVRAPSHASTLSVIPPVSENSLAEQAAEINRSNAERLQDSVEEQKRVTQEFQEFQRLSSSVQKEFQESETEARQLHQIINQLRSVRMASKGESESLSAERDELRNTATTQVTYPYHLP
eukprot:gene28050-36935_t